jgi:hypothetical protein
MLFDLRGKRRRTVQATYLTLAVLMGAGLVLFGIGSSVSGGLGDLFKGGNGSNQATQTIQKKIDAAEKTLVTDPKNTVALAAVTRGHYQLATATADANTGQFKKESQPELQATTTAWKRYEAAVKKPDTSLAALAVQAYEGLGTLTKSKAAWAGAADATQIVAAAKPNPNTYISLVQYASLAGQTRLADLAGKKAIQLAPKGQRKAAQQQVAAAKAAGTSQAGGGTTPAPSGTAP